MSDLPSAGTLCGLGKCQTEPQSSCGVGNASRPVAGPSSYLPWHESLLSSRQTRALASLVTTGPLEAFVLRKNFQGFKLEKTPPHSQLQFPFSGQPRKW